MENITVTARESQFMLDVMLATLYTQNHHNQPSPRKYKPALPPGWDQVVEAGEMMGRMRVGGTAQNENIPECELPIHRRYRSLGYQWYRRLFAELMFFPRLLFQL
jgi:hypothetical protein